MRFWKTIALLFKYRSNSISAPTLICFLIKAVYLVAHLMHEWYRCLALCKHSSCTHMLHTFKIYHFCYGKRETRQSITRGIYVLFPKATPCLSMLYVMNTENTSHILPPTPGKLFAFFFPGCCLSHNSCRYILALDLPSSMTLLGVY